MANNNRHGERSMAKLAPAHVLARKQALMSDQKDKWVGTHTRCYAVYERAGAGTFYYHPPQSSHRVAVEDDTLWTRSRDGRAMQGPEFMQEADAAAVRKMAAANFGSRRLSVAMAEKDKENAPEQNTEVERAIKAVLGRWTQCFA